MCKQFLDSRFALLGHAIQQAGQLAQRQMNIEERLEQFLDGSKRHPRADMQVGDQTGQVNPEAPLSKNLAAQIDIRNDPLLADSAITSVDYVLSDINRSRVDVNHLPRSMNPSLREGVPAVRAAFGKMVYYSRRLVTPAKEVEVALLAIGLDLPLGLIGLNKGRKSRRSTKTKLLFEFGYPIFQLLDLSALRGNDLQELANNCTQLIRRGRFKINSAQYSGWH